MKYGSNLPLVVVVDDEPATLRSLERLLRNEPCELVVTEDPDEALAWARLRPVALILVDHRMPKMTGAELVSVLAVRSPSTASILISGYPYASDLPAIALRQVRRLIAKPWDDEELLQAVRDCLPRVREVAGENSCARPIPVPCKGRSRQEILSEISRALRCDSGPGGRGGTWILLEDLALAHDSVAKLLAEVVRLAARRSARLILSDNSSLASTFLEGIGGVSPLVTWGGRWRNKG